MFGATSSGANPTMRRLANAIPSALALFSALLAALLAAPAAAHVKVTGDAYAAYLADPAAWGPDSPEAADIAKLTGANAADVPALLKGYVFPALGEQAGPNYLGGATVKAIADTAAFLAEQGKIAAPLADYSAYVNPSFAAAAAAE